MRQRQLEANLGIAREQRGIAKPLAEQGVFPRVEYLRLERDVSTLEGDLATIKLSIPRAKSTLKEAEQRVQEHLTTFRTQLSDEMNKRRQEAQSLFDAGFEAAKRAAAPKAEAGKSPRAPARPSVALELEEDGAGIAIEPAGPALPAPDGLRIPLIVRDASGKRRKLTLSLRFESEDA